MSIDGMLVELRRLSAGTSVHVLEKDELITGGVRFLGTTLWTDFRIFEDKQSRTAAKQMAVKMLRDFSRVWTDDALTRRFTPQRSVELFADNAAWLETRLREPFDGPTVVITHHTPSPGSIHPQFAGSLLNACFVSDLERLMDGRRVALWIHGHTHDSFDYWRNGTHIVCNPRGYAHDGTDENPVFSPTLVIDLDHT